MAEPMVIDDATTANNNVAASSDLLASPNANGHDIDTTGDEDQSPSHLLRRSTRASALKAQEKLKVKDGIDGGLSDGRISAASGTDLDGGKRSAMSMEGHENGDSMDGLEPPKKLRLADKLQLDQTDPHFAIQLNDDGQVILLSDDSEVSSLHDSEVDFVRKNYDKVVSRELTSEQKRERELMIMQLQAELRLEEAKLSMLKKIRMSQQIPPKQDPAHAKSRAGGQLSTGTPGNSTGNAYRPPVAQPANRVHNQVKGNASSSGQRAPQVAHQGRPQVPPHVSNGRPMQTPTQSQQAPLRNQTPVQPAQRAVGDSQTPAQRQAAAKLALRRQLEQQLLLIPAPRPAPPEMHFVPNHNQPDFCYLLGMDLAVQRVLKDKNVTRGPKVPPYVCVQCGTDFTPVWKAIGHEGEENDGLTLKCEQCVKANEKKQLKAEHTTLLRTAFNKALQQEQELEKQIKEGKFDAPVVVAQSSPAVTQQQPPPMVQHVPAPPQKSSGSMHHHQHHTPPQQSVHHPAVQQLQTQKQRRPSPAPAASSSASSNHHAAQQQQQQQQQQQAVAAQAAAFQRSITQNPMFAAMLSGMSGMNPMMQMPGMNNMNNLNMANILQMGWNPSIAQRFPNLAMAALAQAAAAGQGNANMNAATNYMNNPMMTKEMVKQLQQQQQNLQRQMLMDMMPKQQQQQQRPNSDGKYK